MQKLVDSQLNSRDDIPLFLGGLLENVEIQSKIKKNNMTYMDMKNELLNHEWHPTNHTGENDLLNQLENAMNREVC